MTPQRTLAGYTVCLGVCGSIAAYKSVLLLRELQSRGAAVRVVASEASKAFVGPATFSGLTGDLPVYDMWNTAGRNSRGTCQGSRYNGRSPRHAFVLVARDSRRCTRRIERNVFVYKKNTHHRSGHARSYVAWRCHKAGSRAARKRRRDFLRTRKRRPGQRRNR